MSSHVCEQLISVWQRRSIAINGDEAFEDSQAIWFQAASRYADLRVPLKGNKGNKTPYESFAGTLDWQIPELTFHHQLDLTGTVFQDKGHLEDIDGDDIYETGSIKIEKEIISFKEHWQRQTEINPPYIVYERRHKNVLTGIAIVIADHGIYISDKRNEGGDYKAIYCRINQSGKWQSKWQIDSDNQNMENFSLELLNNSWCLIEESKYD